MGSSSQMYITCEELWNEFNKCRDDDQKRIMIFDVRDAASFAKSHLCPDPRSINLIGSRMRVFNIDPDKFGNHCTPKNIFNSLGDDDRRVFNLRRHANDAIIIERDTDDIGQIESPRSKVMRLIKAMTTFDTQQDTKLTVPLKILKGGYREWLMKYPHFTTNPLYNPDDQLEEAPSNKSPSTPSKPTAPMESQVNHFQVKSPLSENGQGGNIDILNPASPAQARLPSKPPTINKPVPTPPQPVTPHDRPGPIVPPKPPTIKNAPGTAVPVTPNSLLLRPTLPRSHSSPNVAQADGDELEVATNRLDQLALGKEDHIGPTINNNHVAPSAPLILSKPRFDRTLKPSFNSEPINAIRAQIDFGRSPEASIRANTGLQNLGNTCFMNSVIQCLAYAPTLVSYFCSNTYYKDINFSSKYGTSGELAIEFGALVEILNSHRYKYIEPKSFRDSVTKHIGFVGNQQQDSHEFMMMLFDKMHHDLNKAARDKIKQQNGFGNDDDSNHNIPRATLGYQFWKRHLEMNRSVISELFEGIFMSTLTCTSCGGQSNTFEVFNCLSLPISSESRCHVRDCLRHFSNPERIEAAWECPKCKLKRAADKKIVICKLPKILIIHLKRFSLVDGIWRQKLQTTVDFPLNDLTVDCTNVLPQSAYEQVGTRSSYNLFAVVNHYGSLDGGHYTAFCKMEDHGWYTFDDSNVTVMKDVDVCRPAAYILFYATSS